jgi:hypothetical protein
MSNYKNENSKKQNNEILKKVLMDQTNTNNKLLTEYKQC